MPKLPMDYSKCCIYKIEHIDDESLVYVGHTTNFDKRKAQHKINCNYVKSKAYNYLLYKMVRDNGGWQMFKMIEVEKYSCNDKREAERRENEVMKELRASMNTNRSYETIEVRKERIKKKDEKYYAKNKTQILKKKKEHYEANKEQIQNKQSERIKCECGIESSRSHLKRHQASKKHLDKMNLCVPVHK